MKKNMIKEFKNSTNFSGSIYRLGASKANTKNIPQISIDFQGFGRESAKAKTNQKTTSAKATSDGTHVSTQLRILNKLLNTSNRSFRAFLIASQF
jgi:cytochrome c556